MSEPDVDLINGRDETNCIKLESKDDMEIDAKVV